MLFMRKKRSGIIGGMLIGAAAVMSVGAAFVISNKTVRKEVKRELIKWRDTFCDICGAII